MIQTANLQVNFCTFTCKVGTQLYVPFTALLTRSRPPPCPPTFLLRCNWHNTLLYDHQDLIFPVSRILNVFSGQCLHSHSGVLSLWGEHWVRAASYLTHGRQASPSPSPPADGDHHAGVSLFSGHHRGGTDGAGPRAPCHLHLALK